MMQWVALFLILSQFHLIQVIFCFPFFVFLLFLLACQILFKKFIVLLLTLIIVFYVPAISPSNSCDGQATGSLSIAADGGIPPYYYTVFSFFVNCIVIQY